MADAIPSYTASSPRSHECGRVDPAIDDETLLSPGQERALAEAVARGDRDAADRLALANLRLVVVIAGSYRGLGLETDDLIGEGSLGLIRAVASFDPGRGVRFATHAAYWIRAAICEALTNTSRIVRIPSGMVAMLRRWRRVERELIRDGLRAPSFGEVAARLTLTEAERERVRKAGVARAGRAPGSLVEASSIAIPGTGAELERAEEAARVRGRVATRLNAREREVIILRFGLGPGEPMTHRAIGERLGITREAVGKIEVRSLAKLLG